MTLRTQVLFHLGKIGRLCVCARGLDILKIGKTSLIYSVSCFSLGAWSFVGGGNPTKALRGDGLNRLWTKVE